MPFYSESSHQKRNRFQGVKNLPNFSYAQGLHQNVSQRVIGVAGGLSNLGNTCYLNSVLQALIASNYIQQCITSIPHRSSCQSTSRFCVLCFFENHCQMTLSKGQTMAPRQLIQNLRLISPTLKPHIQQDAHEFLRLLIDTMQQCCGEARFMYPFTAFDGCLQSSVVCTICHAISNTFDPIEDLGLELSKGTHSVEDMMALHTKPELLKGSNAYRCDGCKKKVTASRRIALHDIPPVLVLQLKRFTFSQFLYAPSKVSKHISFMEYLELWPYLSEETKKMAPQGVKAELYAVVVHVGGTARSGHYYAYVKHLESKKWFKMDDATVTEVDFRRVVSKDSAYMLFYNVSPKDRLKGPRQHNSNNEPSSNGHAIAPPTVPHDHVNFIGPAPPPPPDDEISIGTALPSTDDTVFIGPAPPPPDDAVFIGPAPPPPPYDEISIGPLPPPPGDVASICTVPPTTSRLIGSSQPHRPNTSPVVSPAVRRKLEGTEDSQAQKRLRLSSEMISTHPHSTIDSHELALLTLEELKPQFTLSQFENNIEVKGSIPKTQEHFHQHTASFISHIFTKVQNMKGISNPMETLFDQEELTFNNLKAHLLDSIKLHIPKTSELLFSS